jgi:hypothetical protein
MSSGVLHHVVLVTHDVSEKISPLVTQVTALLPERIRSHFVYQEDMYFGKLYEQNFTK